MEVAQQRRNSCTVFVECQPRLGQVLVNFEYVQMFSSNIFGLSRCNLQPCALHASVLFSLRRWHTHVVFFIE
jgi:hypothetical protein